MNQLNVYFTLKRTVTSVYVYGMTFAAKRSATLCAKFEPEDQKPEIHGLTLNNTDRVFTEIKNKQTALSFIQFAKYFDHVTGRFVFKGRLLDVDDGFYETFSSTISELQKELAEYHSHHLPSLVSNSPNASKDNQCSQYRSSNLFFQPLSSNLTGQHQPNLINECSNRVNLNQFNNRSAKKDEQTLQIDNKMSKQLEFDDMVRKNLLGLYQLNNLFDNKLDELNNLQLMHGQNSNPNQINCKNNLVEKFPLPNLIDLDTQSFDYQQNLPPKIESDKHFTNLNSSYLAKSHNIDENNNISASDLLEKSIEKQFRTKLSVSSSAFKEKFELQEFLEQHEFECRLKHDVALFKSLKHKLKDEYLLEWYKFNEVSQNYVEFKNLLIAKFNLVEKRYAFKNEMKDVKSFSQGLDLIMSSFKSLNLNDAIYLNLVFCKEKNVREYVNEANLYKCIEDNQDRN